MRHTLSDAGYICWRRVFAGVLMMMHDGLMKSVQVFR